MLVGRPGEGVERAHAERRWTYQPPSGDVAAWRVSDVLRPQSPLTPWNFRHELERLTPERDE
jgi:hypothetical protein